MYFSADYFTGEGINQAVLFTLQYGLDGAGFGEYTILISITILLFVVTFALLYLYYRILKKREHPKPKRLKGAIHNAFLVFAFLSHPFNLDLYSVYDSMHTKQSKDFDQYYKKPDVSMKKTNGYNLVYIYAESLEKTYFDETIFPGLMPNLKKLKGRSIEFTNIHQVPGSSWTIAGMTATQCSIPLFTVSGENSILQTVADENAYNQTVPKGRSNKFLTRDTNENSMGNMDSFLRGAECLGDVLTNLEYHLVFMQGSSNKFSGIDKFYTTHHFDEIYGKADLLNNQLDKSHLSGWGLHDDTLFDIAYNKFDQLSEKGKQFSLFMATIDTHHPNGHLSKNCKNIPYGDGDNSILNAVHCSDYLISKFINKLQNSEYAEKTLIVITSDHLSMRNTAIDMLLKGKRRNLFLIFDPKNMQYIPIDKNGSMFDVAPTVLSKLGVDSDLGLGRNLLDKDSLYSIFENFNQKLLSWRSSILSLWEFPKIDKIYEINALNRKVTVSQHTYNFPVLFKVDKNKILNPIFETSTPKKLSAYFEQFTPIQKFIWIDDCKNINILFENNETSRFCVVQGSLSSKNEVIALQNERTDINATQLLKNTQVNLALYQKRQKRLELIHAAKNPINIIYANKFLKNRSTMTPITKSFFDLYLDRNKRKLIYYKSPCKKGDTTDWFFLDIFSDQIEGYKRLGSWFKGSIENNECIQVVDLPNIKIKAIRTGQFIPKVGKVWENVIHTIIPLSNEQKRAMGKRYIQAKKNSSDTNRFIAHAGGIIDGYTYTNSLEALNVNYANGFKLFELDIIETSDNVFVAAHDWKKWKKITGYEGAIPPTREIFKKHKIRGKYTPLDINDINQWFQKHPDAILITDKVNKPLEFSKQFLDKNRLMMELFSWDAVKEGLTIGIKSSMPTGSLLKKIQGNKIDYLVKLGIKDIAINRRWVDSQKLLLEKISAEGIHIYAFLVNYDKGKDEKYVLCEEGQYFYGMYADKWDFNASVECSNGK